MRGVRCSSRMYSPSLLGYLILAALYSKQSAGDHSAHMVSVKALVFIYPCYFAKYDHRDQEG